MKTVLLTGGAGFVGHHLIDFFLKNTDYNIVSLDRLDTSGNLNRIAEVLNENPDVRHRVKVVWHDLKAPINGFVRTQLGDVNYILHVAAASHVDRSILHPLEFIMDNVLGTGHMLEYARGCDNLEMFLYFGTDEVFGPAPTGVFFKDNDRYAAKNPYAATKAGAEELCMSYENTYHLPVIATHTMNLYGKRQHPEKFIPLIIRKLVRDEVLQIHANPDLSDTSKRHYLHIDDLSAAVKFLLDNGVTGEKYNIVAKEETDNLDLALMISRIMEKELKYELIDPKIDRPRFDFRYACDGSKMRAMGWSPQIGLEDSLRELVPWYVKQRRWIHVY